MKTKSIKGIKLKEVIKNLNQNSKDILLQYDKKIKELNLKENSIYTRKYISSIFLYYLQLNNISDMQLINRALIISFMNEFSSYSKFSFKDYLAMLKVFLQFLYSRNYINEPLHLMLPKVTIPRQSKIPSIWEKEDIKSLLSSVDRNTSVGKRDYSILLLIIRLGLRKKDVITLKFNNFNWKNKTINIVQNKTGQLLTLPILKDVGWAIIDYIKNARPKSDTNIIFLTIRKPYDTFSENHGNIDSIIYKYMKKADIPIEKNKKNGAHSLRHTLASEMLSKSTPIETISSVLGHVNSNSSSVYLKIDIEKLRECILEVRYER